MNETLGERIRKIRKENKLTQEKLAELSGLSWSFISRVECGTSNPRPRALSKIANALKVDIAAFYQENYLHDKSNADYITDKIIFNISLLTEKQKLFLLKMTDSLRELDI